MQQSPTPSLSAVRLICVALLAGQILFAGIVAVLVQRGAVGEFGGVDSAVLSMMAAGFAVVAVPVAFLLRGARFAQAAGLEGDARLQVYGGAVIVFFAILEGAGLFNIVVWMITGEMIPSMPIVVLLLAVGIASFPSQTQLDGLK